MEPMNGIQVSIAMGAISPECKVLLISGNNRTTSLLADSLRRPGGRRGISVLSVVLFLAGITMFAYPVGKDLPSDCTGT